jgi:hypothetical protein
MSTIVGAFYHDFWETKNPAGISNRVLESEFFRNQHAHRPQQTDRNHQHHGNEKALLRRHAEKLTSFLAADGSGGLILREKLGWFIKPGCIGGVFAKSIKHECILSHGGAQVNLPKLYCHDFVIL